jgi:hypothetical protein
MTCKRCHKDFSDEDPRCPRCGEPNPAASGLFQTSTVLISAEGADMVYRSVDEVPAQLRTKLLKSTNGANSATILIADRKGRKEIAKAMRNLPGPAQRRLRHAILGDRGPDAPSWLTTARKRAILAVLLIVALLVVAFVFTHRWDAPLR